MPMMSGCGKQKQQTEHQPPQRRGSGWDHQGGPKVQPLQQNKRDL